MIELANIRDFRGDFSLCSKDVRGMFYRNFRDVLKMF